MHAAVTGPGPRNHRNSRDKRLSHMVVCGMLHLTTAANAPAEPRLVGMGGRDGQDPRGGGRCDGIDAVQVRILRAARNPMPFQIPVALGAVAAEALTT